MNAPDVTLLVQIIHFLIAYAVLRKLVFEPSLKILHKQEYDKQFLYKSIAETEYKKENALNRLHDRWNHIKQVLHTLMPKSIFLFSAHVVNLEKKHTHIQDVSLLDTERNQAKKIIAKIVSEVD